MEILGKFVDLLFFMSVICFTFLICLFIVLGRKIGAAEEKEYNENLENLRKDRIIK